MIPADKLDQMFDPDWCQRHRKKPLRLLNLLQNRELEIRRPGTKFL